MKEKIRELVFFLLSMLLLLLLLMWALEMRGSKSPYIRFPDKIETFK
jgi:hypothetical protein